MAASSAQRRAPTKQEIEDVQTKLDEMKVEMEAKCAALRAEARRMVSAIKSNYNCEMMKIPKKIRSMDLQEFMQECGGDIATVMARNRQRALESRRVGPASSSSSRPAAATVVRGARPAGFGATVKRARVPSRNAALPATPSGGRVHGPVATPGIAGAGGRQAAGTGSKALRVTGTASTPAFTPAAARLPRKGEVIMSTRGSPLGSFAASRVVVTGTPSTTAPATTSDTAAAPASIALALESAAGGVVELRDASTAAALSEVERQEAASKIANLQEQLNSLMAALQ